MSDGFGIRWRIIDALRLTAPQSPQSLAVACGCPLATIRGTLQRMLSRHEVARVAFGSYQLGAAAMGHAQGLMVTPESREEATAILARGMAELEQMQSKLLERVLAALQKAT